jgi:ornithine carbamoyltransferase
MDISYQTTPFSRRPAWRATGHGSDCLPTLLTPCQEAEAVERQTVFMSYQVNEALMSLAKPSALFMHCLPAHRGQEVTADVFESTASVVFEQAENRLHCQKALLAMMLAAPQP